MEILYMCNATTNIRGYYYYKKGFVKELKKIDENIYSSVVSGTYNYNVILNLNNLRKCSCSCPYKVKICKHVMATYYTVFPEEAKQYEEGLKLVIKGYNEHKQRKEEQYNEVYKRALEHVNSLTVAELKKELINFIVDRDYYDEYDPYNEEYEEEMDILYELDDEIIEELSENINDEGNKKMLKLSDFINAFEFINEEDSWINLETGDLYNKWDFEAEGLDEEEIEDLLWQGKIISLPMRYELNEYNDMVLFADSIENEEIRNKLYKALNGKGAFSRFKKEIAYLGIREKWFAFRDERLKEKVKQWLEDNEIEYIDE
ncbi:MAG: SWIM zinc finger family protein [Bacilli bacterium]|nr:SWIM zinc finger family protein [Bacilli bacterium]